MLATRENRCQGPTPNSQTPTDAREKGVVRPRATGLKNGNSRRPPRQDTEPLDVRHQGKNTPLAHASRVTAVRIEYRPVHGPRW
jgi:hypothetical protein